MKEGEAREVQNVDRDVFGLDIDDLAVLSAA